MARHELNPNRGVKRRRHTAYTQHVCVCDVKQAASGASLTVLKHPHCGHSHASVVKYSCSDRASLCARVWGLVVIVQTVTASH